MIVPGSANPLLLRSAVTQYQVSRSLRFNSSDSASCARTFSSGSSTTTQTLSLWVKRAKLGATGCFWSGYDGGAAYGAYFQFESSNALTVILGGASLYQLTTTQVFRDPSSWYHIVLTIDTNNGTSGDRIRLYVNGSRVTTFSTASYPTSGYGCQFALGNANNRIGTTWGSSAYSYFDGYLADIHFIDGQALTPSSFTEVSATTGQLIPKAYTGTFGTNGFWLKFSDNSNNTATTLGKDYSPNGNNWTPTNLSVTAGAGNDSLVDTPTSYGTDTGAGGEVRGNYATLNPLKSGASVTLSDGNLTYSTPNTTPGGNDVSVATIGMSSGKWYCEWTWTAGTNSEIGIAKEQVTLNDVFLGGDAYGWMYYNGNGNKYHNNSNSAYGATYAVNDVIGIAFDADVGTLTFYKNGVSQGAAYTGLTSGPYFYAAGVHNCTGSFNFGQRPFAYTAPSGFKALCDTNLPAPVVAKPSTVMDVKLYTGNGSTQTISGLGFSPDLVWGKSRSASTSPSHYVYDIVRGASNTLTTNATDAEYARSGVTAFNSDGFTLGSHAQANENNVTYVAWTWDAGSSTVTNTAGSITSSVRANASAGFSIVTYTGNLNGTGVSTVGHGLGVAPSMVITKRRNGTSDWCVQHTSTSSASQILFLNSTSAQFDTSGNGTLSRPTSTVFSVNYSTGLGVNGQTHVAYCFGPVAGYSAFGSYTGNGSSDGPFIYTGFRPRWVMVKCSSVNDSSSNWVVHDTARDTYNVMGKILLTNLSNAELTDPEYQIDCLANGFKVRTLNGNWNRNAGTYVWAAFAESPLQYARAR